MPVPRKTVGQRVLETCQHPNALRVSCVGLRQGWRRGQDEGTNVFLNGLLILQQYLLIFVALASVD